MIQRSTGCGNEERWRQLTPCIPVDSIASTNQRDVKEEKGVEGEQGDERELRDRRMYVNTARSNKIVEERKRVFKNR